jgi:hypothetical protein
VRTTFQADEHAPDRAFSARVRRLREPGMSFARIDGSDLFYSEVGAGAPMIFQ